MTPEERLIRMENLMQSLIEGQVQLQAKQTALTENQLRHAADIEKNTAAIRDLIVLARTSIDAQQRTTDQIDKLREAQQSTDEKLHGLIETVQSTDEKLHALIETVDRIIRNLQK